MCPVKVNIAVIDVYILLYKTSVIVLSAKQNRM